MSKWLKFEVRNGKDQLDSTDMSPVEVVGWLEAAKVIVLQQALSKKGEADAENAPSLTKVTEDGKD